MNLSPFVISLIVMGVLLSSITAFSAHAQQTQCWDRPIIYIISASNAIRCLDDRIDDLGSGGGNVTELQDLSDVVILNPEENEYLRYNGTHWIDASGTGGSGCTDLDCLTDAIIISPSSGQALLYNGTHWRNMQLVVYQNNTASNLGAGAQVFKEKSGVDLRFRSFTEGTGIDLTQNADDISIANTLPEATTAANLGTASSLSEAIFESEVTNELRFKRLLEGSNITLSSNSTHITIASTGGSDTTACTNSGSGNGLCNGGNVNIKSLIAGTGITIADTTDDYTVSVTDNYLPKPHIAKYGIVNPVTAAGYLSGYFLGAALGGTESNGDDADGVRMSTTTGTTAGTDAGVTQGAARMHREWNVYLDARVQQATTTGGRLFIGLSSLAEQPNTDTPCNSQSCAAFLIRTTDTQYQIVTNDGDASQDVVSTGITEDTNVHRFTVRADAANNRFGFSIDGGAETFVSSEIPAATTDLFMVIIYETSDNVSDTFEYYYIYAQQDK